VLRPTQPPTVSGTGNEEWLTGYGVNAGVADWSGGVSDSYTAGPMVR